MRDYRGGKLLEAALAWARPLGLRRMARDLGLRQAAPLEATHFDRSCQRRAGFAELFAFDALCRSVTGGLGDMPLAVVTSSELDPNRPPDSRAQRRRSRFYRTWATLQDELATLSTNSTHAVAEHAGHFVHQDDPELVTKVIIDLVRRARSTTQ